MCRLLKSEQDAVDYTDSSACAAQSFVPEPIDIGYVTDNADGQNEGYDFGKPP